MRKLIRSLLIALLVLTVTTIGGFFAGRAYGISITKQNIDALAFLEITNEVNISEYEIEDIDEVKVKLAPIAGLTQPDTPYLVRILIDGVDSGNASLQWTAAEITAGTAKPATLTGFDLTGAVLIKFKATH